jgi:hypothetical protein
MSVFMCRVMSVSVLSRTRVGVTWLGKGKCRTMRDVEFATREESV